MRRTKGVFLAGALLLAVSAGNQGMPVFAAEEGTEQMEELPQAESEEVQEQRKGETHGGTISFGNGKASITIQGKEGQSLVGKHFYVYQLFFAENAKGGESINYTFHPKYQEAVKTVVAKGLTESGKPTTAEKVTEYMWCCIIILDTSASRIYKKISGMEVVKWHRKKFMTRNLKFRL